MSLPLNSSKKAMFTYSTEENDKTCIPSCASKTFYSFHNLTGFIFSVSNNTYHSVTSDSHSYHCAFVSAINANLLLAHNSHSYESKNSKISFCYMETFSVRFLITTIGHPTVPRREIFLSLTNGLITRDN